MTIKESKKRLSVLGMFACTSMTTEENVRRKRNDKAIHSRKLFRQMMFVCFFLLPSYAFPASLPAGTLVTVAGNGSSAAYAQDGQPALLAALQGPIALVLDLQGNLYFSDVEPDGASYIRKIDPKGIINTIAGNATNNPQTRYRDSKIALNSFFVDINDLVADSENNLYLVNDASVGEIDNQGIYHIITGFGNLSSDQEGPAIQMHLIEPVGLAFDSGQHLYISDIEDMRVREIDDAGILLIVAGKGPVFVDKEFDNNGGGFSGDGGSATNALLNYPDGLAFDPKGNLYIGDILNHRVRKVDQQGIISTYAGSGSQSIDYSGEGGPATQASISNTARLTTDAAGNLFIGDIGLGRILEVTPQGIIKTVVGTGQEGFGGDGGPATEALIGDTGKMVVDGDGNLIFTDISNKRLREVLRIAGAGIYNGKAMPGSGDVNRDGVVDIQDVLLALQASLGLLTLTPEAQTIADANGDGQLDVKDVLLILQKVIGNP